MTLLVSDVHFGANQPGVIEAFLRAAEDEARNDRLIIIPGDLTMKGGRAKEYAQAERFVQRLLDLNLRVVLTPGNHDFGKFPGERLAVDDEARDAFGALLKATRACSDTLVSNDFDSIHRFGSDVFVALRSTHRGTRASAGLLHPNRVRQEQIDWCVAQLREHRLDGTTARLHFVTHRSLWRDNHPPMHERKRLESKLLARFGFTSFIHGHNHRPVADRASLPHLETPIVRISVPTLSTRTSKEGQACGWMHWRLGSDELPRFVPSP